MGELKSILRRRVKIDHNFREPPIFVGTRHSIILSLWFFDRFKRIFTLITIPLNYIYHYFIPAFSYPSTSPGSSSSSSASYRSTPSPPPIAFSPHSVPLSSSSVSDEGIVMDYYPDELPRKKKVSGNDHLLLFITLFHQSLSNTFRCCKTIFIRQF